MPCPCVCVVGPFLASSFGWLSGTDHFRTSGGSRMEEDKECWISRFWNESGSDRPTLRIRPSEADPPRPTQDVQIALIAYNIEFILQ